MQRPNVAEDLTRSRDQKARVDGALGITGGETER